MFSRSMYNKKIQKSLYFFYLSFSVFSTSLPKVLSPWINSSKSTSPLPSLSNTSAKTKPIKIPSTHPLISFISSTCNSLHKRIVLEFWNREKLLKTQLSRVIRVKLAEPSDMFSIVFNGVTMLDVCGCEDNDNFITFC